METTTEIERDVSRSASFIEDGIPVEYVLNGSGEGYWLVCRTGIAGDEIDDPESINMEEVRAELKAEQENCPFDPDEEPKKYKEWMDNRVQERKEQILEENFFYEFREPFEIQCLRCGFSFVQEPIRDNSIPFQAVYDYKTPLICPNCDNKTSWDVIVPKPPDAKWPQIHLNERWRDHLEQNNGKVSPTGYAIDKMLEDRTVIQEIPTLLKEAIVFPKDIEATVVACAAIASWKLDCFNSIPYIGFWGAQDSGKTQAMTALSKIAYHASKAAGISAAAIARMIEIYRASLMVDEIHDHLSPKNPDAGKMRGILKSGYLKGMDYTVCEQEGKGIETRRTFGLKGFTGERPFSGSLLRRCINIFMEENEPKIDELYELDEEFNEIRNALLSYRLMFPDPPRLETEDRIVKINNKSVKLKGGILQLFRPILRVAKQFDFPLDEILEYAYEQELRHKEDMLQSEEAMVVYYIYKKTSNNIHILRPKEIAQDLDILGKTGHPSPHRVGHILKSLDLETDRDPQGKHLDAFKKHNSERLSYLYEKYKCAKVEEDKNTSLNLQEGNTLEGF